MMTRIQAEEHGEALHAAGHLNNVGVSWRAQFRIIRALYSTSGKDSLGDLRASVAWPV